MSDKKTPMLIQYGRLLAIADALDYASKNPCVSRSVRELCRESLHRANAALGLLSCEITNAPEKEAGVDRGA